MIPYYIEHEFTLPESDIGVNVKGVIDRVDVRYAPESVRITWALVALT